GEMFRLLRLSLDSDVTDEAIVTGDAAALVPAQEGSIAHPADRAVLVENAMLEGHNRFSRQELIDMGQDHGAVLGGDHAQPQVGVCREGGGRIPGNRLTPGAVNRLDRTPALEAGRADGSR